MSLRVCFFGTYDRKRPRNSVLLSGLSSYGAEVSECHFDLWGALEDKSSYFSATKISQFVLKLCPAWLRLTSRCLSLPRQDFMVVGYLGHLDIVLARFLSIFRRTKVVLNFHISLLDTVLNDRQLSRSRILAGALYLVDRVACTLADMVLVDTAAYGNYLVEHFDIPSHKLVVLPVGADSELFKPNLRSPDSKQFRVLFYGQFIPLHGIDAILAAAAQMQGQGEIEFTFIGTGQEKSRALELAVSLKLDCIHWIEWVNFKELSGYINRSDVCLGIFGESDKAKRVIPNKVFQAAACGKAIVTLDTPAIREFFTHGENIYLCPDQKSLGESLLLLKDNPGLRLRLGQGAFALFQEKFTPLKIADALLSALR